MSDSPRTHRDAVINRIFGVGTTAALAIATIVLWATGKMAFYINPDGAWFAGVMAIIALIGCALSFAIPLGGEDDHGHDHGTGADPATSDAASNTRTALKTHTARTLTLVGGALAVIVAAAAIILPPASLSAQTAIDRDLGVVPLFGGDDVIALATTGDTATFGVGDWARVFATTADTRLYEGVEVTLTGFITPDTHSPDGIRLTRLVITHCVIDAQPASVSLSDVADAPQTGQWVTVNGTIIAAGDGTLAFSATSVEPISEPADPYEY